MQKILKALANGNLSIGSEMTGRGSELGQVIIRACELQGALEHNNFVTDSGRCSIWTAY